MYVVLGFVVCAVLCIVICKMTYLGVRIEPSKILSRGYLLYGLVCALCVLLASCSRGPEATTTPSTTPVTRTTPRAMTHAEATAQASQQWDDWFTYHHDNARSGYLAHMPDPQTLTQEWNTQLDGAVYGQSLMVKGQLIAVTENDTVFALNPLSGKVLWQVHVGTPVPQATLPCGDIDPLGITGTPVYDPATNQIFAVAEVTGPQHVLVGIDATSGHVRQRRVVDVAGMDPAAHQERAALVMANKTVYIAFGGLAGDCSDYRGTLVAAQTDGQGALLSYRVPTAREAGMWAPSGPAIDSGGNVFASFGNGASTSGAWDHSDSVLRFSPRLQLEDSFAPQNWGDENSHDTDLGSTGPLLLPDGLVFIAGKSGNGYILHANALGGIGGQVSQASICDGVAMGGGAVVGSSVLVPCNDGVRRVTIGSQGQITIDWHADKFSLSPTVGGHTVYSLSGDGTLYAADLASGAIRAQVSVGDQVPHFVSPMLSGHSVFVGTMHGVTAVLIS